MSKIVFLDTNIYLHYRDFDQIDWLKVLATDTATIIIPPVTIRELNKLKDSNSRTRIRNRSGLILKKLSGLFISSHEVILKDNVAIAFEDRDPLIDFGEYQLSREIQDDNLIASIIMCKLEKSGSEIILVTSDAGLTLKAKAKRLGIITFSLSEEYKIPEEPDPDRKRIKELEQTIRELEQKIPQLSLTFEDGSPNTMFTLPIPVVLLTADIEDKVKEIKKHYPKREKLPKQTDRTQKTSTQIEEILGTMNISPMFTILPEDIAKYNTELDEFYQAYVSYLEKEVQYQSLKCRTIKLQIYLSNEGTAPAEDIDIYMHFPDGFRIINEDKFPEPPKPPDPPSPPKKAIEKMMGHIIDVPKLSHFDYIMPRPILPPPNVSPPHIRRTKSYDVEVHVQRVKHKLREQFDALYVVFESFDDACSFHINYRILAANLPNEILDKLHVIIQKD